MTRWLAPADSEIVRLVSEFTRKNIDVYGIDALALEEHCNQERRVARVAYHNRQLFELVQNGADALVEAKQEGRIEVVVGENRLYCANEGAPVTAAGVESILHSGISRKSGSQIGHFGVGLKSVLAVTNEPKFYSRSGSFGFDRALALERVRAVVPAAGEVAVLRIAHALDPHKDGEQDPLLRRLMGWASTIVVLPYRDETSRETLVRAVEDFPAEFLLFTRAVKTLLFSIEGSDSRLISSRSSNGEIEIEDRGEVVRWRVFERSADVSEPARKERDDRDFDAPIPVMWAMPLEGRPERQRYWSFFPTDDVSPIGGILNSGWKTTEDRRTVIIDSLLNKELAAQTASLVADSLPLLFDADDPARHLDLLPPREINGDLNEALASEVYGLLALREIVPDARAELRLPADLTLQPDGLGEEIAGTLRSIEPVPDGWAHDTLRSAARKARARALGTTEAAMIDRWLEAMVSEPSAENSAVAVRAAAQLQSVPQFTTYVRRARFILTATGSLVAPDPQSIYLSSGQGDDAEDVSVIHPDLAADEEIRRILQETFWLRELDEAVQLRAAASAGDWPYYYEVIARSSASVAATSIRGLAYDGRLHVRNRLGRFVPFFHVLLPGDVVPGGNGEAAEWCLDDDYHRVELSLLISEARVAAGPVEGGARTIEEWWDPHLNRVKEAFVERIANESGRRTRWSNVRVYPESTSGPLDLLKKLPPLPRAHFTEKLLPLAASDSNWLVTHTSADQYRYEPDRPPSGAQTAIVSDGHLLTSLGAQPVSAAVARELEEWSEFLPVSSHHGERYPFLGLPRDLASLDPSWSSKPRWSAAFARALQLDSLPRVAAFYVEAARAGVRPARIRCQVAGQLGVCAPQEVVVTSDRFLFETLTARGDSALLVRDADEVQLLVGRWELQEPSGYVSLFGLVQSGPATPAGDRFPQLGTAHIALVPCADLWLERPSDEGLEREPRPWHVADQRLYHRDSLADEVLLEVLADEFGVTPERQAGPVPASTEELRDAAIAAFTPAEKLSLILGPDALRRRIPTEVLDSIEADGLQALELAQVAHALYGTAIVAAYRMEFTARGFPAPAQFAGGARAVEFVRQFGFDDAYAGTRSGDVLPWIDVDGPVTLPRLHDFQETAHDRIRAMLREPIPDRGLLSLPTGAGKTRIVVEAVTGALRDGDLIGVVLWIADRDELCEQAFQTWIQAWRALGAQRHLRLSRLWGKTNDRVVDVGVRPHVVVATYQTLVRRLRLMDWLASPSCIIVDEAHGSTTPSFTRILAEAGMTAHETGRYLIGLSATPFRGDQDETRRLVSRYGNRRFDRELFGDADQYDALREVGVLSRVSHSLIPGTDPQLTNEEVEHLKLLTDLPASAEKRLSLNAGRNEAIVEEVLSRNADWPILVFAVSVTHAQILAGELARRGRAAMAITGETDRSARRDAIRQFKDGKIQVLTNYGVLTTGFDAPKVRSVFITRPVFSKSLYQQMIGRGLRGPASGGKPTCEIVNVGDNFSQYGLTLAFRHFEYLWGREGSRR